MTLATVFTYDARGLVVSEGLTRTLVVDGQALTPAATQVYDYDAADQPRGVVMPTDDTGQPQWVYTYYSDVGEVRLKTVEAGNTTVRFVHDARGQRVARIVNEGTASEQVTVQFGRWFEVTGGTLTRHIAEARQPAPDLNAARAARWCRAGGVSCSAFPGQRVPLGVGTGSASESIRCPVCPADGLDGWSVDVKSLVRVAVAGTSVAVGSCARALVPSTATAVPAAPVPLLLVEPWCPPWPGIDSVGQPGSCAPPRPSGYRRLTYSRAPGEECRRRGVPERG